MSRVQAGTKSFDFSPLSPEEKAQRDADALNSETGHENEIDGFDCPECRNRGYRYDVRNGHLTQYPCDCWKPRRSIRRMKQSGLEGVISRYTFKKYLPDSEWQQQIKTAAQEFARSASPWWFFIGGQSGCGKTHICTAICREMLMTKEVRYMLWEAESKALKSVINDPEYLTKIDQLKNIDVLYIDDFFGRGMPSEADIRLAREILNHRYVNGKTTIISSEWHATEINDLDAAIGGRIVEMCGRYCFNVRRDSTKNYRLKPIESLQRS